MRRLRFEGTIVTLLEAVSLVALLLPPFKNVFLRVSLMMNFLHRRAIIQGDFNARICLDISAPCLFFHSSYLSCKITNASFRLIFLNHDYVLGGLFVHGQLVQRTQRGV